MHVYSLFKSIHVLGAIILIGNVTITAFWKVMADRTRDSPIIAHAQRNLVAADLIFTLLGIVLIIAGGYGAAWVAELPVLSEPWLIWGQIMFAVSGAIWLFILVPLQMRQSRDTRSSSDRLPARYWRDSRTWLVWGVIATIPLMVTIWIMIAKPG